MAGNRHGEVNRVNSEPCQSTGVTGVGEFVEMCDGTQEVHGALHGRSIGQSSVNTQVVRDGAMEVGASYSSGETSNDRGAKDWQIDRA